MKRILALLTGAALAAMVVAQTDLESQLKAMQDSYNKENKAHMDAAREKSENGEPFDMTAGPAKKYLNEALILARKAQGSNTADKAYAWAVPMAFQTQDVEGLVQAFEGMIANNPNSKELKQVMRYIGFGVRPEDRAIKLLSRIEYYSSEQETKASAGLMRASMFYDEYSGEGDTVRARGILKRTISQYPRTEAAKRAANMIFAMDNLRVGQMAPDFSATDENGVNFKLSDYRGKVTVVAFWGFW